MTNNNDSSNSNSSMNHNAGWFGMMDRLCGCSYIDAQLCSEQETFGGRSTTIPTSWMKEDSASPIIPRHHQPYPSTVTPPDSPQSWNQNYHTTNKRQYYESPVWKEAPSSPTSTATTVTMRTGSLASVDTTKTIPRQRTNSSLATVYHPQPGPHSFRRSQTEASYASSAADSRHLHHYRYPSNDESDLFHSKVLVSVAFDDDDYNNDSFDHHAALSPAAFDRVSTTAATAGSTKAFHRPRALRRVQTDSLTQLPPLAGRTITTTTTAHQGSISKRR